MPGFLPTPTKDLKIQRQKLQKCKNAGFLTSVLSTLRPQDPLTIKVEPNVLNAYGVSSTTCNCCEIKRSHNSDSETQMKACTAFDESLSLDKTIETLFVNCTSGDKVIYSNVHAIIARRNKFKLRQSNTKINEEKAYKVLLLGINGMSQMNMVRGMPKSYKSMKNNDKWFHMRGYTRIADNSFPNMFAALTGRSPFEKQGSCDPTANSFLDDCDFIWKDFEKAGYVTAYAEDQISRDTFNIRHKGFKDQPTDHYFRPFVLAAEKMLEVNKIGDLAFCLGPGLYVDNIFVYALKMMSIHNKDPYFGLFFVNSLGNKQLSTSPIMDGRISASFVKELEKDDPQDMIVIYLGDTGTRFEETEVRKLFR